MRVVFASHTPWWSSTGGTELFTSELVSLLGGIHDFYTITRPSDQQISVTPYREMAIGASHHYGLPQPVALTRVGSFSEALYETYMQVLDDLAPDVVHVQHLMNIGPEIIHAASALEVPVVCSFHDYFTLCPSCNLLDDNNRFCGVPSDLTACNRCLQRKFSIGDGEAKVVETWRQDLAGALKQVSAAHFPSESARNFILTVHGFLARLPSVVLPTYLAPATARMPSEEPVPSTTVPTLTVLGCAAVQKGSSLLVKIVPELVAAGVRLVFLGNQRDQWELDPVTASQCVFLGPYAPHTVVQTLQSIRPNAVLLPSIWPETYMRTLSEVWQAGLPALVLDYGAQAARVRAQGGGTVLLNSEPSGVVAQILAALKNPAPGASETPALPPAAGLAAEYSSLYQMATAAGRPTLPPLDVAATEIACLTDKPKSEVAETLRQEALADGSTVALSWNVKRPSSKAVSQFYEDTESYLYDLEIASRLRTRRMWRQRILSLVLASGSDSWPLLDYGCGNGADACYYASRGLTVAGFDLPSPHLNLAKRRAATLELEIYFIEGDPHFVPSASFGFVTCFEVLEHVADPPGVLNNIAPRYGSGRVHVPHRVLWPGRAQIPQSLTGQCALRGTANAALC